MGHPSGLYRKFKWSLLLATTTNMIHRSSTGKQSTKILLGINDSALRAVSRYSQLFYGSVFLFSS
jgi:hypothetical protein